MLPRVFDPCFPSRQSFGLISASRDGDLVSILIERSGYGTIRGSSSRKGVIALRQLVDALAAGTNVLITPDGPRGPVYEASQGVVFLAQKTGAPVVPIHMEYSSCWRLKSWDRFVVPRPFAKLRAIFGAPLQVPADSGRGPTRGRTAPFAKCDDEPGGTKMSRAIASWPSNNS